MYLVFNSIQEHKFHTTFAVHYTAILYTRNYTLGASKLMTCKESAYMLSHFCFPFILSLVVVVIFSTNLLAFFSHFSSIGQSWIGVLARHLHNHFKLLWNLFCSNVVRDITAAAAAAAMVYNSHMFFAMQTQIDSTKYVVVLEIAIFNEIQRWIIFVFPWKRSNSSIWCEFDVNVNVEPYPVFRNIASI